MRGQLVGGFVGLGRRNCTLVTAGPPMALPVPAGIVFATGYPLAILAGAVVDCIIYLRREKGGG